MQMLDLDLDLNFDPIVGIVNSDFSGDLMKIRFYQFNTMAWSEPENQRTTPPISQLIPRHRFTFTTPNSSKDTPP